MNDLRIACLLSLLLPAVAVAADNPPDYSRDVAPLLRKYCIACHNGDDVEGGLALDTYAGMLAGGERGAVLTPGHSEPSRIVRVLTGQARPAMPPEGSEKPSTEEIGLLAAWIDAGAKGPEGGEPDPTILVTPKIEPTAPVREGITSVAVSPLGDRLAIARYGVVELYRLPRRRLIARLSGHRGNVNSVSFSANGKLLVSGAGEAGLFGEARLWDAADGKLKRVFEGHRDSVFAARLDAAGQRLATGSYDQTVKLWDVESGKELRTLEGHNGAVFDVAFRPGGEVLATCSGDRTVKLWSVETGERLDTLSESLEELYSLEFSPDGRRLAAAGVDHRIRVWRVSGQAREGTNRLLFARFGHEAAILRLAWAADGKLLASAGEDRVVKLWHAPTMQLLKTFPTQDDWVSGLAFSGDATSLIVGRLDGETARLPLDDVASAADDALAVAPLFPPETDWEEQPPVADLPAIGESEPNDSPPQATPLDVPAVATGAIDPRDSAAADSDLFRFSARKGDQWVVETRAAEDGSPLDTNIEVLDAAGEPLTRVLLRAVRDSEITFRGIDSTTLDCRVTNWEEMELNQLLYLGGEVVRLFRMPRGPDSGFQFYPGGGSRVGYFDTSATAHALGEPCYIVTPHPPGMQLTDNGLPVFPIYFENDDDAGRELESDSRLTFTAPADGDYLVRVTDVRGFGGPDYKYRLIVRRPQPDFELTVEGTNPTVAAGSGKSFTLKLRRIDDFDGPVRVDISELPPGFTCTAPLWIEGGHVEAKGVLNAAADAPAPTTENAALSKITATAMIAGREVTHDAGSLGTVALAEKPKLLVELSPSPAAGAAEGDVESGHGGSANVPAVVIAPGTSITCELAVERNGFDGRIQFDVENLPHGVIVDDIGLSGVLIPEKQAHRTIFLTAAEWVPPNSRPFFAVAKAEGNQASRPMMLVVGLPEDAGAEGAAAPDPETAGPKLDAEQLYAEQLYARGATMESEAALAGALDWLAAHQLEDGGWSFHHAAGPCDGRCPDSGGEQMHKARAAATALALLAFVRAGQTHKQGEHSEAVKKGVKFLLARTEIRDGRASYEEESGSMYSHGMATLALCELLAATRDMDLRKQAQAAVNHVVYAQDPDGGGWRYRPRQSGDTSVTGWQVEALHAARGAMLDVPEETFTRVSKFLDAVQSDEGASYGYTMPGLGMTTSAIGLRLRLAGGLRPREGKPLMIGARRLAEVLPNRGDLYFNYHAHHLLYEIGGDAWESWNAALLELLLPLQAGEGHAIGSFFVPGRYDQGGRHLATTLAAMMLAEYHRKPLNKRNEEE